MMLDVENALALTLALVQRLEPIEVALSGCLGKVLAEEVRADTDMPAFHRARVDGYALRAMDVQKAPAVLEVIEEIPAGGMPPRSVGRGQAAKIMTGAPLPEGADTVQWLEKTRPRSDGKVEILEPLGPGENIGYRGEEVKHGDVVLPAGQYVAPAQVGVLAMFGTARVKVYRAPRIALLSTGDELVEVDQQPTGAQIRDTNTHALGVAVKAMGAEAISLGIARDNPVELREKIRSALSADLVLISGGASVGEYDLVKGTLRELGAVVHYDRVAIKPGKPTIFATHGSTVIFGLPGNPVSSLTIFEVLVRPVIRKMMGFQRLHNPTVRAALGQPLPHKPGRQSYHPAWIESQGDGLIVTPLPSRGSSDLVAYSKSNSLLIVPKEASRLEAGVTVEVLLRDEFFQRGHP